MPAGPSHSRSKGIYVGDQSHFAVPSGFDQFCPVLRQRTLKYVHIPVVLFLSLNKIASNLSCVFNES
jgi:hypothetical protein